MVTYWPLPQGMALTWDLSPTAIHCVAVDPAGQLLACAGGDGTITILDTSSEQVRIVILKRLSEEWWVFLQEWSLCGRAGAAPQRVVGQMGAHAHTRVYQSFRFVRLLCMSVVFRQAHIPTLSPDKHIYQPCHFLY